MVAAARIDGVVLNNTMVRQMRPSFESWGIERYDYIGMYDKVVLVVDVGDTQIQATVIVRHDNVDAAMLRTRRKVTFSLVDGGLELVAIELGNGISYELDGWASCLSA